MGCLDCINRTVLCVLNLAVFLIGFGVIVIASLTLSKNHEYGVLLSKGTFTLPILVLIVGIFLLILGFFGCCGAKQQNSCMLYTYASLLLILVIAQATCGILLLVYKDTAPDFIRNGMLVAFEKYNDTEDPKLTEALDNILHKLECCGVNGPADWKYAPYMDGHSVADGCCKDMVKGCGTGYFDHHNPKEIYEVGCYYAIKDELLGLDVGISGLVLAAGAVQLIIVILSCVLANKSEN